jgi:hypothetical protein
VIRSIITARNPWTLSNGGLVPVPREPRSRSGVHGRGGVPPDQRSAPPAVAAGAVTSSDDYIARVAELARREAALFKETDCEKLAARISSFAKLNKALIDALEAWRKAHPVDDAAVEEAMAPVMTDAWNIMAVVERCKDNPAFAAAFARLPQ